jgi:hypothetical protein
MGEILLVGVRSTIPKGEPGHLTPSEVRSIADWTIKRRIQNISGVAEVLNMGGGIRQVEIQPDPYRMKAYGVTLTELEAAAATATWPREWASGMDRFLKKEPGIDPTNARLKAFADAATNGGARSVSPSYAVKIAARAIVRGWRLPNSGTSVYGQRGGLRGLNFTVDAPWGFEAGGGTPVELAATCVAAVRALGVPSRVVYCLVERSRSNDSRSGTSGREFRMICEFFLPNIGWIPFDPMMMRQHTMWKRRDQGLREHPEHPGCAASCLPDGAERLPDGGPLCVVGMEARGRRGRAHRGHAHRVRRLEPRQRQGAVDARARER